MFTAIHVGLKIKASRMRAKLSKSLCARLERVWRQLQVLIIMTYYNNYNGLLSYNNVEPVA